jgi:hypothetical protein
MLTPADYADHWRRTQPAPITGGPINRPGHRLPSRTSPLALSWLGPPKGIGHTAANRSARVPHPNREILPPGQTWRQSEREMRRNPRRLELLPTLTTEPGERF